MCYFYNVETAWASQMAPVVNNSPANPGDIRDSGLIPELGTSPGRWHDNPLQYSCLENPMDREAWRATVQRVAKSQTRLSTHAMITYIEHFFSSVYFPSIDLLGEVSVHIFCPPKNSLLPY